ncbi:MAG: hypothetical protein J0M05_10765 [Candidatus Kapabacteria bacterium]|nr:hypothetical protein [Candidatus Kapabacteria bacterium]
MEYKSSPKYKDLLRFQSQVFDVDPELSRLFTTMDQISAKKCKSMVKTMKLAFKQIDDNAEIIDNGFFSLFLDIYYDLVVNVLLVYAQSSEQKWHKENADLQERITVSFQQYNNLIGGGTGYNFTNTLLFGDNLQAARESFNELSNQSNEILQKINTKSEELDRKFESITIQASIKNISDALEKTDTPFWTFVILSGVAISCVIVIIICAAKNIEVPFEYLATQNDWSIEIKKMYLIKNSLITLSAIALFSGIFTYSLKMVKAYLNIRTAYNHKLALLSSFDNLVGKEILNPQERHTVTETLIKQIISGDNINLGDNQSSSPSIVQSIVEKFPSSEK